MYLSAKDKEAVAGKTNRSGDDGDTVTMSLYACFDLDW